jgi:hypothetical protein
MNAPDPLVVLAALVRAHAQPIPNTATREPVIYLRHIGAAGLQHHGLPDPPPEVDEAVLGELKAQGHLDISYTISSDWLLTPTRRGRDLVVEHERVTNTEPVADVQPVLDAIAAQAKAANKLAWAAVRPVLEALRSYWERGGLSRHGVQLGALLHALQEEHEDMFLATVLALIEGGYLRAAGDLSTNGIPAEVTFTDHTQAVLDGWPGASPNELVEKLIAVLTATAAEEQDPTRKRRLERVVEALRELGVSVTSEVLSKVITGGV